MKPGRNTFAKNSGMVDVAVDLGPCSTIMVDPMMQREMPAAPEKLRRSLRKTTESRADTATDTAPSGVTRIAGEYAYAIKLRISDRTRQPVPSHQYLLVKKPRSRPIDSTRPVFCSTIEEPDSTALPKAMGMPMCDIVQSGKLGSGSHPATYCHTRI